VRQQLTSRAGGVHTRYTRRMIATATRVHWGELPASLVDRIGEILGSTIVSASSQSTGFSPGLADRVVTSNGRRAFVKAVSSGFAPVSHQLYRREAEVLAMIPAGLRVPSLLGTVDDGDWFALVVSSVEGAHPAEPPAADEVRAVLDTVHAMPSATQLPLPRLEDEIATAFDRWPAIFESGLRVPSWASEHAPELQRLAAAAPSLVRGDRLVHLDLRSDNVLIDGDGEAWILDWPWACVGAGWIDGLTMVLDARMYGSLDSSALLATHPVFDGVAADSVDAVLAGLAALFVTSAAQPDPPNMPSLRAFQAREADAALEWLRERRFF
jgi:aminoglycoside phosphotransferase (APT) family kinase protein